MQTQAGASLSDPLAPAPAPRRRTRLWVGLAVGVVALDQVTKWWAESALVPGDQRNLVGDLLQLRLTYNPGAAFSLGTGYTVVLTLVAVGVIVVGIRMASTIRSRVWAVALGLLLGGALGNVIDRFLRDPAPLRGHVVDFLELPNWPIFNVADVAITGAAVLLVVLTFRGVRLDGTREGQADS